MEEQKPAFKNYKRHYTVTMSFDRNLWFPANISEDKIKTEFAKYADITPFDMPIDAIIEKVTISKVSL
jgi:hypothetical protein